MRGGLTKGRPRTACRCSHSGFPYRSYDKKAEIFYQTDSIAFALEIAPLIGADERTGEILAQFCRKACRPARGSRSLPSRARGSAT